MVSKKKVCAVISIITALSILLSACGGGGGGGDGVEQGQPAPAPSAEGSPATADEAANLADYDRVGTAAREDGVPEAQGAPISPEPAIAAVPAGAEGKSWALTYNEPSAEGMPPVVFMHDAMDHIKARTNGQVDITIYPNMGLLSYEGSFTGVVQGLADMGAYNVNANPGTQPINAVYSVSHTTENHNCQDMTKIYRKFLRDNDLLQEENRAKGVEWITVWAMPATTVHSVSKDIRIPSDLKGARAITMGPTALYFESLGANSIYVGPGDYYTSLEKGVADTLATHWSLLFFFGLLDVTNSHTVLSETNTYAGTENGMQGMLVNKETWDSIPAEYQAVVVEELDWANDCIAYYNDNIQITAIGLAESMGHSVVRLNKDEQQAWYDAASASVELWVADAVAAGMNESDARALHASLAEAIKNKDM